MGAGKTTIGREVAARIGRPFVDTDEEIERRHGPISNIFEERGEAEFRQLEEEVVRGALGAPTPSVLALGGGAVLSERVRSELAASAFTVWLDVEEATAWERVGGSGRPLARSRESFAELHVRRRPVYADAADAAAHDVDGVLLAALRVAVAPGRLARPLSLGSRPIALVADAEVLRIHTLELEGVASTHPLPPGEAAKALAVVAGLWESFAIGRDGAVVAFGGGTTTDVAGFAAATFTRGVPWIALPTTLVGQVDAAIGGKTGVDLATGKNLVGAFHYPNGVIVDPRLLATLPERERRNGLAEVLKTGLLAGDSFWELDDDAMVSACAAFKCAVCLADPYERTGRRAILNLGHTFAHALEAASDYTLAHGEAVALGLLAALRLSGQPTDAVEEILRPEPVRVDRERAWAAMRRDKKAEGGRVRLVLLDEPGRPAFPVELPDTEVRRELDRLIAD